MVVFFHSADGSRCAWFPSWAAQDHVWSPDSTRIKRIYGVRRFYELLFPAFPPSLSTVITKTHQQHTVPPFSAQYLETVSIETLRLQSRQREENSKRWAQQFPLKIFFSKKPLPEIFYPLLVESLASFRELFCEIYNSVWMWCKWEKIWLFTKCFNFKLFTPNSLILQSECSKVVSGGVTNTAAMFSSVSSDTRLIIVFVQTLQNLSDLFTKI